MSTTELMNRWLRDRYSFDESKVKRDSDGQFADKTGGTSNDSNPIERDANALAQSVQSIPATQYNPGVSSLSISSDRPWYSPQTLQWLHETEPDADFAKLIADQVGQDYIRQMMPVIQHALPKHAWATGMDPENDSEDVQELIANIDFPWTPDEWYTPDGGIDYAKASQQMGEFTAQLWSQIDTAWRAANSEAAIAKRLKGVDYDPFVEDDQYSLASRMNRWLRDRYSLPQTDEQSALIADILYHTYGDDAGAMLDQVERYAAKFDELKHKRDAAGRFAKKNESVAAIHDAIKTALSGGQHSPESVQGLADNLSQLTVRELTDLKKQYGISAAGRSKADLVAKVADRLSRGRREAEQQPEPEPEPDVYAPESLFSMNQGLVNALASKMGGQHEQDELRQVGRIALWKASQQWKPDSGTKFSTFAYTGIAQAIKNAQRTEGRQKSKAQEFGVDEEGGDQSQQVPGRDAAPDEDMEKQEQLGQLQDAMQQLQSKSPDAAKMVMMKFSGRKLSEIAAEFGITEQGASQAVNRAVKKLQTMMGATQPSSQRPDVTEVKSAPRKTKPAKAKATRPKRQPKPKVQEKPLAAKKDTPSSAEKATKLRNDIVNNIFDIEDQAEYGAMVDLPTLRRKMGPMSKEDFDNIILQMAKEKVFNLHGHHDTGWLNEDQISQLVKGPEITTRGTNEMFIGVSLPPGSKRPERMQRTGDIVRYMDAWIRERYSFDESKVRRDSDGQFADKAGSQNTASDAQTQSPRSQQFRAYHESVAQQAEMERQQVQAKYSELFATVDPEDYDELKEQFEDEIKSINEVEQEELEENAEAEAEYLKIEKQIAGVWGKAQKVAQKQAVVRQKADVKKQKVDEKLVAKLAKLQGKKGDPEDIQDQANELQFEAEEEKAYIDGDVEDALEELEGEREEHLEEIERLRFDQSELLPQSQQGGSQYSLVSHIDAWIRERYGFDESQPRASDGKWTSGSSSWGDKPSADELTSGKQFLASGLEKLNAVESSATIQPPTADWAKKIQRDNPKDSGAITDRLWTKTVDAVFDDLTDHELAEWASIELAYDMMPDSVDLANYDIHTDADEYDENDNLAIDDKRFNRVVAKVLPRMQKAAVKAWKKTASDWMKELQEQAGEMEADKMSREGQRERYAAKLIAAGLCIQAADTGRVLMLQRSWDEDDDAAGTWEFPGGHIEDGETPLEAAKREWAEETGHKVPKGELVGEWRKGVYAGHVLRVKSEDAIELNMDSEDRHVQNPDDPDGDGIEVVAWWQPEQMKNNPALREELRRDKAKWLPLIQDVEKYAMAADRNEQAALIADILAHIYGDEAASILDSPDQYSLPQQMDMWIRERYGRQWDESQVKRDEKGRFATRAGKLANVASSIQNALQQPKTPQSAKALADELSQLTVKELTDLKKQYQVSASGRTKADLVQKLASRLDMGRREEQPKRPEMADPAETLDADFVDDYFNGDMGAAIEAMERNRAEQISTAAKRGVEYDTDEIDADWMAEVAGIAEEDDEPQPQPKPAKPPANLLGDDDDEPFALQQSRKGRKQEKFETAPSGPQKALFDTGKNDLEGQNLLFNSDAGAGEDDPTTMENRMKNVKPKGFSRHLGREKHGVPTVGERFEHDGQMYQVTSVEKPRHYTRDQAEDLEDFGHFGVKSGWHVDFTSKPVERNEKERAALQKKAADATQKQREKDSELSSFQAISEADDMESDEVWPLAGTEQPKWELAHEDRNKSGYGTSYYTGELPNGERVAKKTMSMYDDFREMFYTPSDLKKGAEGQRRDKQRLDQLFYDHQAANLKMKLGKDAGTDDAKANLESAETTWTKAAQEYFKKHGQAVDRLPPEMLERANKLRMGNFYTANPGEVTAAKQMKADPELSQKLGEYIHFGSHAEELTSTFDRIANEVNQERMDRLKAALVGVELPKAVVDEITADVKRSLSYDPERVVQMAVEEQKEAKKKPEPVPKSKQPKPATKSVEKKTGATSATFAKLANGSWGLRVLGPVQAGDTVKVKKKDGSSQTKKVKSVVKEFNDATLVSFYGMQPSEIEVDRYSHLSPRGERIERLVAMMAAGFEQFVNMAGAAGSGVPLLSQPPTPINPWNAAYADATNQDPDKQLSRYERKSSGWITLNAEDGEGTKVYIGEGGEVTAGPKGMTGKTLNGDKPKKPASKKRDDSKDAEDDDPFNAPSRSEAATDADDDWRFETQKIPWQARKVVDEVAERWGVDGDEMIPLAQEKLRNELANWETREAVKKHARKSLGLNSRVTSDMENSRSKRGEDFANLSGLDEFITEAQGMYPDFNWGDDPAESLMQAVHEGAKPKPKLHDKAILDSAARYLFQTGQVAEAVPFSMLKHFPRTRYSHTVAFDNLCDEFLENALKSLTS